MGFTYQFYSHLLEFQGWQQWRCRTTAGCPWNGSLNADLSAQYGRRRARRLEVQCPKRGQNQSCCRNSPKTVNPQWLGICLQWLGICPQWLRILTALVSSPPIRSRLTASLMCLRILLFYTTITTPHIVRRHKQRLPLTPNIWELTPMG